VQAAQEARRLAGMASAAASDARASALGVRSSRTDLSDDMGMNIAGGYEKVKKEAAALDISADEYSQARRGDAGFFSAAASDARASALGVRSSRTDWPDGMGMNIAGGYEKVKKEAAALHVSANDLVGSNHWLAASHASEASALVGRGKSNPKKGKTSRNNTATKLGELVGSSVMGQEDWAQYIITSCKDMIPQNKPFTSTTTQQLAKSRSAGERDGWAIHDLGATASRWCMSDIITYRLPDHTEEIPDLREETFQAVISVAYHCNWERHCQMVNKNKKDKDAGRQLYRG